MNQNIGEEKINIENEDNANNLNLPLEEKIKSQQPQIRKQAYEEISSTKQIDKYDYAIEIFLSDSSQISLQSALELVLDFIKHKQPNPDKIRNWSKIIIEQTYGCNHVVCQDLCKEIMCELLSSDYDSVMSSIKVVMTKNAKAIKKIMQCEMLLDYLISEFGLGIHFEDINEVIKGLTSASNPGVRNYAMTILKNIYKWDKENVIANELLKDKEKEAINDYREINDAKRTINPKFNSNASSQNDNTIKQKEKEKEKEKEKKTNEVESNVFITKKEELQESKNNNTNNENEKLYSYYNSNEFLDKLLLKHQKGIEKKKLLEELLSFLMNQHEPIESNLSFGQYDHIFETLQTILNENNGNVIIAEIGLLSYFSKLFLHNQQYINYITDLIPKLLDKFNLQSNVINNSVHSLLNELIEYNLSFNTFFVYLENISIDDNINYTLNLLTFAFEQIKKDEKINIKNIPNELTDLFQKLSIEDNNEISNLAFNMLEILNMRNYLPKQSKDQDKDKDKDKGKQNEKEQEENYDNKQIKKGNIEQGDEESKKKGEGKTFRKIKKKKGVGNSNNKNNNAETDEKEREAKIEPVVDETHPQLQPTLTPADSQRKVLSSKHLNYDDIVIGPGRKPNPTNELLESIQFKETEEINTNKEDQIEVLISKPSNKIINTHDEKVVGGKSNFNQMFPEEMHKIKAMNPLIEIKERAIAPKKNALTVEEMEEMYNNKQRNGTQIESSSSIKEIEKQPPTTTTPLKQSNTEEEQLNEFESQTRAETYTKESKQQALEDFQKKVDLALQNQEDKENIKNENGDITEQKKILKEETQFEEIKSILGQEIVLNLDDTKWEMKKQGLESINKLIQSNSIQSPKSDELYNYIKYKLKKFKETNFNVNREAITLFTSLFTSKQLSYDSKHYYQVLDVYYDKYSDGKLKEQINQLILSLIDIQSSGAIIKSLLSKLQKKPNVNLLKDYSALFVKCVEDYEINQLPIKEMVDLCKTMASNSNPQVRTASTSLLCALYTYIGNDIKVLIKDIKESTLKIIEAEFSKITVINPILKKKTNQKIQAKKTNNNASAVNKEDKSSIANLSSELIPRVDISKKITAKLIKDINDGKWPEKKEACEAIEKIILDANMKILPNGLNDLFNLIKAKLSDSNKNIVRMIISLLCKLIEACGSGFKAYAKPIALALLSNFADKMQALRDECHLCFEKWIVFVGFDTFVYYIPSFIKTDNFDIRTELMRLIMKNKELFNKQMGEALFKEMVSPLLLCLQDRAVSVRIAAEEMIVFSLQYITLNNYQKESQNFKPAIANDLRGLLEKIKIDDDKSNQDNANAAILNTRAIMPIDEVNDKKDSNNVITIQEVTQDKPLTANSTGDEKKNIIRIAKKKKSQLSNEDISNLIKTTLVNTPTNTEGLETSSATLPSNSTLAKSPNANKTTSVFANSKKSAQPKLQIFQSTITNKQSKEKRYEIDKKFKFSLETMSFDSEFKLKDQVKGIFTEEFNKKLFNEDFKQIVEAINCLKSLIEKDENTTQIFDNLDLILKIIGYKANTIQNPSMLKALFDFLEVLYTKISSSNYQLNDTEINIIIILLVDKLGVLNSTLKELLQSSIDNYFILFTSSKSITIALNFALGKNIKIKSEILDICTDFYLKRNLDITNRQFAKLLSKFLLINDNSIKYKTIALFREIYSKIGDELWSYIDLKGKERELLEANLYEEGDEEEYENNNDNNANNNNGNKQNDDNSNKSNLLNGINQQNNLNITNAQGLSNYSNYQGNLNKETSPRGNNINGASKGGIKIPIVLGTNVNLKDKNDLLKTIRNLVINDIPERVNTIIIIHEFICAKYEDNKELLISNIDDIIKTFIEAMHNLFSIENINDIPIKFTKYLATVLCKIASNKELISGISYEVLFNLTEEILFNLLVENLDKIGENQEGSIIFKSLNSTMLRILENCNPTHVIITLLDLIKTYRAKESKLAGLAIKCLLKINQNIQQIINSIEIDKILLQFHLLLCNFDKNQTDLQIKTQTDQMILRYIKNFLNETVKIKKEDILDDYILGVKPHPTPDKYILKWIKSVLSSLNIHPQYPSNQSSSNNLSNTYVQPNYETVHTTENIARKIDESNIIQRKETTPEKKSTTVKKNDILDDLKSRMMKQQGLMKPNRNMSSNLTNLNSLNFNNTISELKKKWNDVNKKSKGGN